MADVRLTATNPEDSSVVPVACDASGRLLLEEPQVVEGPQGPEGPPGPKGNDGDPFSGNFADNVTFDGSAEFAGNVTALRHISKTSDIASYLGQTDDYNGDRYQILVVDESGDPGSEKRALAGIKADGSASFAESITVSDGIINSAYLTQNGLDIRSSTGPFLKCEDVSANQKVLIKADGSAEFAGNKAGFTAEGYLWCTTRRGDTVILDATSNGLGSWVEYTPTTRIDDIRDKLDANRPDTGDTP